MFGQLEALWAAEPFRGRAFLSLDAIFSIQCSENIVMRSLLRRLVVPDFSEFAADLTQIARGVLMDSVLAEGRPYTSMRIVVRQFH